MSTERIRLFETTRDGVVVSRSVQWRGIKVTLDDYALVVDTGCRGHIERDNIPVFMSMLAKLGLTP